MKITVTAPICKGQTETINGYKVEISNAPALSGSEKQVAWADAIRAAAIEDLAITAMRRLKVDGTTLADASFRTDAWEAAMENLNSNLANFAEKLASVTDAKAWIEAAGGSKSILTIRALLK